jgi:hypothetical protein
MKARTIMELRVEDARYMARSVIFQVQWIAKRAREENRKAPSALVVTGAALRFGHTGPKDKALIFYVTMTPEINVEAEESLFVRALESRHSEDVSVEFPATIGLVDHEGMVLAKWLMTAPYKLGPFEEPESPYPELQRECMAEMEKRLRQSVRKQKSTMGLEFDVDSMATLGLEQMWDLARDELKKSART